MRFLEFIFKSTEVYFEKLFSFFFQLIETGCFDELNVLGSNDEPLIEDYPDDDETVTTRSLGCFSLSKKSSSTSYNSNNTNNTNNSHNENMTRAKPVKTKSADVNSNDDESTTQQNNSNAIGGQANSLGSSSFLTRIFKSKTKSCSSMDKG